MQNKEIKEDFKKYITWWNCCSSFPSVLLTKLKPLVWVTWPFGSISKLVVFPSPNLIQPYLAPQFPPTACSENSVLKGNKLRLPFLSSPQPNFSQTLLITPIKLLKISFKPSWNIRVRCQIHAWGRLRGGLNDISRNNDVGLK